MRVRVLALTLLLTVGPGPATAHDGSTGPPPAATLLALVLGVVVYTRGLRRLQARGRPLPVGRHVAALVGGAALALALLPPVDRAAGILLSVHMAQHVLLTVVAAPLLALARPLAVLLAAAPRGWRPRRIPGTRRPAVIAWATHGAALWAWHLPPLYDVALTLPLVHAVEHATLLGTAVWLWWSATERRPAGALWLFTTAVHTSALGALLTLAPRPWFTGHHGGAGLTTLEDQQLAGLVMWVPAGTVLTGFALALLATWLRQAERRAPALARPPALVLTLPLLGLALAGCDQAASTATAMTGGDPARGREAMPRYGCQTCHTIPGVTGADGTIGPPLAHLAVRAFVAGQSNSPEHLIAWIRHPQHVRPASPMPEMGVSEEDGRDIAAYLYTLR